MGAVELRKGEEEGHPLLPDEALGASWRRPPRDSRRVAIKGAVEVFLDGAAGEVELGREELMGSCGVCEFDVRKCVRPAGRECMAFMVDEGKVREVLGDDL